MNEVLLPDIRNLSFDRLSKIRNILQPALSSAVRSDTLPTRRIHNDIANRTQSSPSKKHSRLTASQAERQELALHIVNSASTVLESWKDKNSASRQSSSSSTSSFTSPEPAADPLKTAAYEAISLAFKTLYEHRGETSKKSLDVEKRHLSTILKLLDVPMIQESLKELQTLIQNLQANLNGTTHSNLASIFTIPSDSDPSESTANLIVLTQIALLKALSKILGKDPKPVSNKIIIDSVSAQYGIKFWVSRLPSATASQKYTLFAKLFFALSNRCSIPTSFQYRIIALRIFPTIEEPFVNMLLASYSSLRKKAGLSPQKIIQDFGELIVQLIKEKHSQLIKFPAFVVWFERIYTSITPSKEWEEVHSLITAMKQDDPVLSVLQKLKTCPVKPEDVEQLSKLENLDSYLTNPAFHSTFLDISAQLLESSQYTYFNSVLKLYLLHLHTKVPALTKAFSKISTAFFHHVKQIIDKEDSESSTYSDMVVIYDNITEGLIAIEDTPHLMYVSNSLLPIGARLRQKKNPIYIEYWRRSVSIELDLYDKTAEASPTFPGKVERLAVALVESDLLEEAFEVLRESFIPLAASENITRGSALLPCHELWQTSSSVRLINILTRLMLEGLERVEITFKNMSSEIEGSILEQVLILLEKHTKPPKEKLALMIMEKLNVIYAHHPLRLLRACNSFFKSTGIFYNSFASGYVEKLLSALVTTISMTSTNRRASNNAFFQIDTAKYLSDVDLAPHRYYIISCASLVSATSMAATTQQYQYLNCSVNYAIEMFRRKLKSDTSSNVVSHVQSLCSFLDLQGANEKRAELLKAMRDNFFSQTSNPSSEFLINRLHCRLDLIKSLIALGYTGSAVREVTLLESEYSVHLSIIEPVDRAWLKLRMAQGLVSVGEAAKSRAVFKSLFSLIQSDELLKMPLLNGRPATEERQHFQQRSLLFAEICCTLATLHSNEGNVGYGISQTQKAISFLQGFLKKFQNSSSSTSHETVWQLTSVLINAQIQLAMSYEKLGIIREACYFVEEASKAAQETECGLRLAAILAFEAEVRVKMGNYAKGTECLQRCQLIILGLNLQDLNVLYYARSAILSLQRQRLFNEETEYYVLSDKIFSDLQQKSHAFSMNEIAKKISRLSLTNNEAANDKPVLGSPSRHSMTAIPAPKPRILSTRRSLVGSRPTSNLLPAAPLVKHTVNPPVIDFIKDMPVTNQDSDDGPSEIFGVEVVWNSIIRSQVYSLGLQNSLDGAISLLEDQYRSASLRDDVLLDIVKARNYYLFAQKLLSADQVFSFVLDSAVSIPSIVPNSALRETYAKSKSFPTATIANLEKALRLILQNVSNILVVCNATEISSVSSLLNTIQTSLAAIQHIDTSTNPAVNYSNLIFQEISRSITLESDRDVVKLRSSNYNWPTDVHTKTENHDSQKSLVAKKDIESMYTHFHDNILSVIPPKWAVVSINVSAETGSLSLCRFEKGLEPFQVTLPLSRHSSRDANEEAFSFELGMQRLREIITKSNESASAQRTSQITTSGERHRWWKERYDLDQKLEELLADVEYFWLGGFTGIFSPKKTVFVPHLLENLEKQFIKLLRTYLPSRNWVMGGIRPRSALSKSRPIQQSPYPSIHQTKGQAGLEEVEIEIDSRIFRLFVGLGDPENLKDPVLIEDLTYYVLDTLQFHGERNAFDEIEIDQLMVHLENALHSYHVQVADYCENQGLNEEDDIEHVVLVLDRKSQAFPWESIPCLRKQSVTRVPTLSILADLLEQYYHPEIDSVWPVVQASLDSDQNNGCYYILNPGRDLPKTQERFQSKLESLQGWTGLTAQEPSESELVQMLETGDLVMYIGHGSGQQYIRAAKIKSLAQCCPTLLLGCSSGALQEAGDYDPWGTPVTYMIAGCPMLLANMWDVTDKDIDLFSTCMLERLGILPPPNPGLKPVSMGQAVTQSRDDCNLRFLNGAAPVVYGLPMKIVKKR